MKNILLVLVIVSVGCVSCDGRKSKSESLKTALEEFNLKQSNFEIATYYPKEYTEVVTDTIISNQIKVHIKNYSDENDTVLISNEPNSTPKKVNYHRVFESDVVISTPTKQVFKAHISAEQFKSISKDIFWNNATLQQVWVNQELSTIQTIQLDMSFINPKEKTYKLYRMSIDGNGQQQLNLIEQS